jgi:hypothetical protein
VITQTLAGEKEAGRKPSRYERDSSGDAFKGSKFVLEDVVERGNATTVDERWLEHGRSVVGLRKRKRRHVEHSTVDLGVRRNEARVLLIYDTKNVDTGLKRSRLDSDLKGREYVGGTDVGGHVFLEEDGSVGGHGRRRTSHMNAYYLTSGLVDVDGSAHAFFVLDTAKSEVSFKGPIGVVHGDRVRSDLPGRGDVGLNGRGSGVGN